VTSPAAIFRGKTRKDDKREKRARHAVATAKLREEVFSIARGRCQKCRSATAEHLHHAKGGSGRRRQEQKPENTVALCRRCHEYVHAHPKALLIISCPSCEEPWCPKCEKHYFECDCEAT
jgi:uncharacterized CHY-type Zn-finger protein